MEKFNLKIGTIEFDDAECRYCAIYKEFMKIGLEMYERFVPQVQQCFEKDKNAVGLVKLEGIAKSLIDECVEQKMVQILIDNKIYTYDLATIREKYGIYDIWQKGYNKLCEKWTYYKEKNDMEHAKREALKDNRGRWQGGGFGVKGALKGAATAGVLNAATGLMYSMGNAVGNARSDSLMKEQMEELFSNQALPENLGRELLINILKLTDILGNILNRNGIAVKLYSYEENYKCNTILNNYSKIPDNQEKKKALLQCFKLYPFVIKMYQLYIEDFYEGFVQETEFDRMGEFFGHYLAEMKEDVLSDVLEKIGIQEDEEGIIRLIQLYRMKKQAFGISDEPDVIELEQEYIVVYDISVKKKLTDTVLLYQKDGNILKEKLQKGKELISGNTDLTVSYLMQRKKLREMYEECDFLDKNSILQTLGAIQNEVSQSDYQGMGQDIVDYLQICAELIDAVFDFDIVHDNLEKDIKNYKPGKFIIQKNVEELSETECREYLEGAYHYVEQSEKEVLVQSILEIKEQYESLNFEDENAVNQLQEQVNVLYQKTGLGKGVLDELKERKEYIDKCIRTVLDIEYETREEADEEREKVAGNKKYDSVEEAQKAKQEIDVIENELKKASGKGSMALIQSYKNLRQLSLNTPSAQERLKELEKRIVGQYEMVCEDIEEYKAAKKGIVLWSSISVVATLILFVLFMAASTIGKIICFCIFCLLWNKVYELKSEISEFDKENFREKESIESAIHIKNKSICLIGNANDKIKCPSCGYEISLDMAFCPNCGETIQGE